MLNSEQATEGTAVETSTETSSAMNDKQAHGTQGEAKMTQRPSQTSHKTHQDLIPTASTRGSAGERRYFGSWSDSIRRHASTARPQTSFPLQDSCILLGGAVPLRSGRSPRHVGPG
eukprot:5649808-Prymnesium_polylepis.2